MNSSQSLPAEGEEWFPDNGGLRNGSREGTYVGEDWNLESGNLTSLSLFPCFVGQRHPMNSMMETMTMTRKATWRFKSGWACCVPRYSFLPLGWVGGKRCGSSTPGQVTLRAFTNAGGGFGDHILFWNQLSPLFSLPRSENGTY